MNDLIIVWCGLNTILLGVLLSETTRIVKTQRLIGEALGTIRDMLRLYKEV